MLDPKNLEVSITGEEDEFTISGHVPSFLLGASVRFRVNFKPDGTGTREAVLHIGSNDKNEGDFQIKLSGTGEAL